MSAVTSRSAPPTTRRLRPEKRDALVCGARTVFARHGYVGASTEAIARAADVSTRTLYKHFAGKDDLFRAVLIEGAHQVAESFTRQTAEIDAGAGAEATVTTLGRALAAHRLDFPEHFALTQQVATEHQRFPPGLLDEWRQTGPRRVEREVARLLAELAAADALVFDDIDEAAFQLVLLTAGAIAFRAPPGTPISRTETDAIITRGARTYLYGHTLR